MRIGNKDLLAGLFFTGACVVLLYKAFICTLLFCISVFG